MAEPATDIVKTGSENEPAIVHCKLKTQCSRETHYHNSKGECIYLQGKSTSFKSVYDFQ